MLHNSLRVLFCQLNSGERMGLNVFQCPQDVIWNWWRRWQMIASRLISILISRILQLYGLSIGGSILHRSSSIGASHACLLALDII